jgi:hypothetical protein
MEICRLACATFIKAGNHNMAPQKRKRTIKQKQKTQKNKKKKKKQRETISPIFSHTPTFWYQVLCSITSYI